MAGVIVDNGKEVREIVAEYKDSDTADSNVVTLSFNFRRVR